jgi:hypothetical protein
MLRHSDIRTTVNLDPQYRRAEKQAMGPTPRPVTCSKHTLPKRTHDCPVPGPTLQ